jgi:hypothetical protein
LPPECGRTLPPEWGDLSQPQECGEPIIGGDIPVEELPECNRSASAAVTGKKVDRVPSVMREEGYYLLSGIL